MELAKKPRKKRRRARSSKDTVQQVTTARKRAEALEYRLKGAGYNQIAEWMKCSSESARRYVDSAIDHIPKEPAEKVIEMELNRLDVMLFALDAAVSNGEQNAIQTALRIMERRARYLGLDAATKVEATGKDGAPLPAISPVVIFQIPDNGRGAIQFQPLAALEALPALPALPEPI